MPQSRWTSDNMTFFNIQAICDLLEEDHCTSILEISSQLQSPDCARRSEHKIIHDVLGFRKLSSQLVSQLLTNDHTQLLFKLGWTIFDHISILERIYAGNSQKKSKIDCLKY